MSLQLFGHFRCGKSFLSWPGSTHPNLIKIKIWFWIYRLQMIFHYPIIYKNNHRWCSVEKGDAGLQLYQMRIQWRGFPVNFMNFLETTYFKEILRMTASICRCLLSIFLKKNLFCIFECNFLYSRSILTRYTFEKSMKLYSNKK